MAKFTLEQRVEAFAKLGRNHSANQIEENQYRQAYAQSTIAPILQRVRAQSSIMSIFTPVQLGPKEQATFQVEPAVLPSTNKYTGAPTDPLLIYDAPGRGPVNGQILYSKTFMVPTGFFEHESGYPVEVARRAQFDYEESHRIIMADAIKQHIEGRGWDVIKATAVHGSFPATQSVEIAVGNPGAKSFSIQLFGKIVKLLLDIGIVNQGIWTPTLWVSNQSFEDHVNWGVNTQFDTSEPAQIAESLKEQLSNIAGVANVSSFRGIPIVALRDLQTGDNVAGKDYCYMVLRCNLPIGLVLPVVMQEQESAITGLEEYFPMAMMANPFSVYANNEILFKVRWECGYTELDARNLTLGIVDRT